MRVWLEPSTAITQTCERPSRVDVNTMWFPSGEKLGSSLLP